MSKKKPYILLCSNCAETAGKDISELFNDRSRLEAENKRLKPYETVVYRFVDRLNDPAECDLLHDIAAEFVEAVIKLTPDSTEQGDKA